MRVRSALAFATHQFFQQSGFQYLHTPIISAADCEGAGELFQVRLLNSRHHPMIVFQRAAYRPLTAKLRSLRPLSGAEQYLPGLQSALTTLLHKRAHVEILNC